MVMIRLVTIRVVEKTFFILSMRESEHGLKVLGYAILKGEIEQLKRQKM